MKLKYSTDFRPNFEARLAFVWLSCGAVAWAFLFRWLEVATIPALFLIGPFLVIGGIYGVGAAGRRGFEQRLRKRTTNFLKLPQLMKNLRPDEIFIGTGFDWSADHAQKVADLYQSHESFDTIRARGEGATFLHGIGPKKDHPLYLTDEETKGHTLIVGTTGAGKTRLFDLLVTQSVMQGQATVIIDPKGDRELCNNARAAYQRVGREEDFSYFHPSFPDESCAIDPLANFQRDSELASRIAAIIPSEGAGDVFQSYSQNALAAIFYGIIAGGEPPTILDLQEPLTQGSGRIVYKAIERWAVSKDVALPGRLARLTDGTEDPERRAQLAVNFYQSCKSQDPKMQDTDLDSLVGLFEHDQTHFSKMVASLIPVIGQLCSGPLKELLSPAPQKGRVPKSGKIVNLGNVVRSRGGVYIGLDTLSDGIVGSRIGQLVLSDLTAMAGAQYNFGGNLGFVNIFVDEAAEVVTDKLIQLLNKGRGARFRIFLATQTLADFEARSGSSATAAMMTGNMNSVVMLRTISPDTQESLSKLLPEVPISYLMKTASTSLGKDASAADFSVSHGERLMQEKQPMIAPQTFGDLSDLEYFVRTPRGRILKGRLPILEAPDEGDIRSSALRSVDIDRDDDPSGGTGLGHSNSHQGTSLAFGTSDQSEMVIPTTNASPNSYPLHDLRHPQSSVAPLFPIDRVPSPSPEAVALLPNQFPPVSAKWELLLRPLKWIQIVREIPQEGHQRIPKL